MSPDLTEFTRVSCPEPSMGKAEKKPRKRRRPPFSVRLSETEYLRLVSEANGAALGAYVKFKVFGGPPIRTRRAGARIEDHKAFGKALAMLGQSRLSNNVNQLARLANIGALPVSPEIEKELQDAFADIRAIRSLLIEAVGLSEDDGP